MLITNFCFLACRFVQCYGELGQQHVRSEVPRGLHGRDKQEALGIRNRLLLYEQHFAAQQILQPDEYEQAVQQVREAPSPATPQQLHAALS